MPEGALLPRLLEGFIGGPCIKDARESSTAKNYCLVSTVGGKGVHTSSPFSRIPSFLEIEDVPTFYRPIKKTKVLRDSFN